MSTPTIDTEAMREKYRQERDKRLRPEGMAQYDVASGGDSHFGDPFAGPPPGRAPIVEDTDVVVLGGGFAGVLSAGRLREAGVPDVRVIDQGADFGGTWYWNRFPGIQCDVESYIYLPLLEEVGYMPTEKYAGGDEIRGYLQSLARHFDVYRNALFRTRVTDTRWDEAAGRWLVATDRGDRIRARFLVLGTGAALNRPKLPRIPGREEFTGRWFHTSRWDFDYTGGSAKGGLSRLADKRLAVIGTGATAIQCVPHLAAAAGELFVFQRTPSAVDVRGNGPTDTEWFKNLEPGWQKRRKANFDMLLGGLRQDQDLIGDQWTQIWGTPEFPEGADMGEMLRLLEQYDFAQMDRIRRRIDELVDDPATADALKPYYNVRCKRPTFNDVYLQSFNRPNVTLVDTQGVGVERISAGAVHAGGVEYPVECIVYATGFESLTTPDRAGDVVVIGREGRRLQDKWRRVQTLHGVACHGFPNMFVVGGIRHAPITINVTYMITEQSQHVAELIGRLLATGAHRAEVTLEAEQRWADAVAAKALPGGDLGASCTPGFYNNEGRSDEGIPIFATHYGGGPLDYIELLARWRAESVEQDLHIDGHLRPEEPNA